MPLLLLLLLLSTPLPLPLVIMAVGRWSSWLSVVGRYPPSL
jgi:hypothetical protein